MQNLTNKTWFQFLVALPKGRVAHEIFMLSINWKVQFYSQQNAMFILLQEGGRIAAVSTNKRIFSAIAFKLSRLMCQESTTIC